MFWCPISAVQPAEEQSVPIGPPSDRRQGDSEYEPAGPFRQVDYLGRPAVYGRRGHGARDVVVAEVVGNQRRHNRSVVRCYATLWRLGACMLRRVARRSRRMASTGAKRGVVVAEACIRLRYE